MVTNILRKRIFFVPLVAEKFGRGVKPRSVHKGIQQRIDLLPILLIKAHRVRLVDKFADNSRLAAIMKDIRKDALLVVVVAPTVYDIVAS